MDLFKANTQLFTSQDIRWNELLRCFYQLFGLLFWRHLFTADDPLVSKWCNAYFLQKQTYLHPWMTWWVNHEQFSLWVNYSFNPHVRFQGNLTRFDFWVVRSIRMFFFLKFCYVSSFRVMNMHAKFQHADVFWRPKLFYLPSYCSRVNLTCLF